jgi:tetratricopeptide (TPR) repeat protein
MEKQNQSVPPAILQDRAGGRGKSAGGPTANPLQPVHEVIRGGDPDLVCMKYGITRSQLDEMMSAYQASRREAAVVDAFTASKSGRNDPCPCGSGKKYKKCCLPGHEEARKLIPAEQLQQMEQKARVREKFEKEVRKGFELIFSQEYTRADQFARKQIEAFPEDDRFHDILLNACLALGDYDEALQIARNRLQTAVEEELFFQENGFHKREGMDHSRHVHFYSPSSWLERLWVARCALTWREQYPVPSHPSARGDSAGRGAGAGIESGSSASLQIAGNVRKLNEANDLKRFPAKQKEGLEARRQALAPVLETIQSEGTRAIPFLLPITFNFTWASLFVPELLHVWGTDECLRLLAELSMFRYPYFSRKCLSCLEETGERAIGVISLVLEENPGFDELKAGLLNVLGNLPSKESFEILAGFTEHENPFVAAQACESLERHKNPEAIPYLERAKQRLGTSIQFGDAIKEIAELPGK